VVLVPSLPLSSTLQLPYHCRYHAGHRHRRHHGEGLRLLIDLQQPHHNYQFYFQNPEPPENLRQGLTIRRQVFVADAQIERR
jgi:hypothetical protein